jgi:hypothetical protein
MITSTHAQPSARVAGPDGSTEPSSTLTMVQIGHESYVVIEDFDQIPPFFCSLTSDANLWMFVSSTGSLTAGRGEADQAILPYETVDRIHDSGSHTGPVALIRWKTGNEWAFWQPFQARPNSAVKRRLMKNVLGSRLVFEETLLTEGLVFSSTLMISERFGMVRECRMRNLGPTRRTLEVLHGIQNLVPSGVTRRLQGEMSCLTDAYKQNEIIGQFGPGVYSMASGLTDQPVPCESLRATVAWSCGLSNSVRSVDRGALDRFRGGEKPIAVPASRGVRAHYLEAGALTLGGGHEAVWMMMADTALDQSMVAHLQKLIESSPAQRLVAEDVVKGEENLRRRLAAADGWQESGDPVATAHHLANVLFNVMRGGIFPHGYDLNRADFVVFLGTSNRKLSHQHAAWLETLPATLRRDRFQEEIRRRECPQLERIFLEYLPLAFSRRHGDPSRPWNQFKIQTRDRNGEEILFFQGNWRDIFQNWEALALSFPEYLESMISKFVNASTVDGYNPYRLTREGIDWEEPEPDDPWAAYGYWGDHQIVYLLKLLEACEQHDPGLLASRLGTKRFTYANVPYRIKPLPEILRDPRNTLTCDVGLSADLRAQAETDGSDAKLLAGPDGQPTLVTLMEKLLVPVLAKWSNFVPGGGIWMNTQRPEWNDANNALVGNGLSLVTLAYLRRHQHFIQTLVAKDPAAAYALSTPVVSWLEATLGILGGGDPVEDAVDDGRRREVLLALAAAGDVYRNQAYNPGFTGQTSLLPANRILRFLSLLTEWTDATLHLNQRPDGLYHSYNLMRMEEEGAQIHPLDPMLEGQVAVLSAQVLSPAESADLLTSLGRSELYCSRRKSFLLYPDRPFTPFLDKNILPAEAGGRSGLLASMLAQGDDRLVCAESENVWRFHPDLHNAECLARRVEEIGREGRYGPVSAAETHLIGELYERVFKHHSFTGRSGSMFAYEGLGSIYWHMVSKLLLATQEILVRAQAEDPAGPVCRRLDQHYEAIRDGLGFRKSAADYGAFPTDPYSHTPAHAGAQQPGMTGQVKEEILTRRGEFGVWIRNGQISFAPIHDCFRRELTTRSGWATFAGLDGQAKSISLPPGSVGFTVCQTPIISSVDGSVDPCILVHVRGGEPEKIEGNTLSPEASRSIFRREGRIHHLEVFLGA